MGYLIEFRDATPLSIFDMAPETALEWFKAKGLRPTFDYRDMIQQEHDVAFTVAKMMDVDLLRTTQDLLAQGMAEGWSKERFTQALAPKLQAAGWWGAKEMEDPLTGNITEAQLGSAHRIKTIYRSNLQSAYSTGQWERIQEQAQDAPWLIYDAVDDHRTREEHGAWDNLVLPVDDPFWRTHMPPNGYNCRCGVIQASDDELEAMGLTPSKRPKIPMKDWTNPRTGKTYKVPQGIDPGWAHNPGQARIEELQKLLAEKAATLSPEAQQAIAKTSSAYQTQQAAKAAQQGLAQAEASAALQRSQAKIQETTAAWQIQNHLDNKTPYMAAAIKAIQKTKGADDLTPSQLLAQAGEKAAAAEKSAFLTTYKQYVAKGKQPPAKAQAVFDALPSDEKAKVSEQLSALQAKKAAEEALAELEDGSGAYAQALAKLKANGQADGMGPVQLWKAVTAEAEATKAKIAQGVNLANYKKAVIAGKTPKDGQLQAYKALDPETKAKVDEEIEVAVAAKKAEAQAAEQAAAAKAAQEAQEAAKAKPKAKTKAKATTPQEEAPAPAVAQAGEATIHPEALSRIGPQAGSNPGGLFLDEETGIKWYIKKPASADIAKNEVLAGKLYRAAGIEVPDLELIDFEGGPAIASRIIDGLEPRRGPELGSAKGAREGFVVDAWLANWDVVGLQYDNLLVQGGRAVRVDTGGALRYRAQGGMKGAAWGNTVDELDSLRNPSVNPQAASVFGDISEDELLAGARSVLAVSPAQIRKMVDDYGPRTKKERDALYKTLVARQEDIARRFPEAAKPKPRKAAPPPRDSSERVTQQEHRAIEESRANGYTIATDKDQIEDQEVLFWRESGPDGKPQTAAELKVRAQGMAAIERLIKENSVDTPAGGDSPLVKVMKDMQSEADDAILAAIKGMKANQAAGLRDKDIHRANDAIMAFDELAAMVRNMEREGALPGGAFAEFETAYLPTIKALRKAKDLPIGATNYLDPKLTFGPPRIKTGPATPPPQASPPGGVAFRRVTDDRMQRKEMRRGHLRATGDEVKLDFQMDRWEADVDGVRVEYWGQDQDLFAMTGRLRITAPGGDPASSAQVYATLERLGIDTSRPSPLDQEELYLRQMAYIRRKGWTTLDKALAKQEDQSKRIQRLKAHLKKETGVDVSGLPSYRPEGRREAFDNGHVRRYRADLHGKEWEDFKEGHRLIHQNYTSMSTADLVDTVLNSGGKMITTTEKLRRGIPLAGLSPKQDLRTGGANYFFTRIKPRGEADNTPGFIWKADQVARTDAISYDGDKFGKTRDGFVLRKRKSTVEEYRDAATKGSNETIFKNGLSLFDGLEAIRVTSEQERQAILATFRKHGYDRWPDGRELEEVVITKQARRR
ncbi:MAG: phage minor head protein [Halomonas sp.]